MASIAAGAGAAGAAGGAASGSFAQEAAVYFVVKIVTSLDDLVWLSPFAAVAAATANGAAGGAAANGSNSGNGADGHQHPRRSNSSSSSSSNEEKARVFLVYLAVCVLITFAALALAWLAGMGLDLLLLSNGNFGADLAGRVLNVVGGLCIAVFAFFEWRNGGLGEAEDEGDQEEGDHDGDKSAELEQVTMSTADTGPTENTSLLEKGLGAAESPAAETDPLSAVEGGGGGGGGRVIEEPAPAIRGSVRRRQRRRRHVLVDLFVVGVLGQLDTLAVLVAVLVGRSPPAPDAAVRAGPVLAGSLLAAGVVILLAYLVTLFKPLTRCLQRVPLWALLCAIAAYVLLQGVVNF